MTGDASPEPIRQASTLFSSQQTPVAMTKPHARGGCCCSWCRDLKTLELAGDFPTGYVFWWKRSILQHWNTLQEHADVDEILMENCHILLW